MEGLAALSLASNIVQFVHFGAALFSETSKLYHSAAGTSVGHAELGLIAENAKKLSVGLEASLAGRCSPEAESNLRSLSGRSKKLADELLIVLEDLRVNAEHRRWESFKQAVKSVRKEKKIDDFKRRLSSLQDGLVLCLLVLVRRGPMLSYQLIVFC
jgi:hypothetical protein